MRRPRRAAATSCGARTKDRSGNYAWVRKRSACNKSLRNALYQFAWQSTLKEAWAADYYRRKRGEGKSHAMAIRALANQWVRTIYALLPRMRTPRP